MHLVLLVDLEQGGRVVEAEVEPIERVVELLREGGHDDVGVVDDVRQLAELALGVDLVGVRVLVLEALEDRDVLGGQERVVPVGGLDEVDAALEGGREDQLLVDPPVLVSGVEGQEYLVGLPRRAGRAHAGLQDEEVVPVELAGLLHPDVVPLGRLDLLGVVDGHEGHEGAGPRAGDEVGHLVVVEARQVAVGRQEVDDQLVGGDAEGRERFPRDEDLPVPARDEALHQQLRDGVALGGAGAADVDRELGGRPVVAVEDPGDLNPPGVEAWGVRRAHR